MTAATILILLLAAAPAADTAEIVCASCAEWNLPQAPFRVHGNTSYVGVRGLSAVLVVTPRGLILLDAPLPQSVPLVAASIRALGHQVQDVKWIVVSHAHFDHVGGVAAMARLTGAQVAASPRAAQVLRTGMVQNDDPQRGFGESMRFAPVAKVVELGDGATIALGGVTLTAHHTPGHTPGGTSWTWRSCEQGACVNMVYADSLMPVSAPGFRFSADPARVQQFRRSIEKVRALACDVLICPHPGFSKLFDKHAARGNVTSDPMIDPEACRRYADRASKALDKRLGEERLSGPASP